MQQTAASQGTEEREITAERIFNAPIELVWKVWTDPRHLEKWWGPNGFITTTKEFDFKAGGVWNHIMHGPDGTDYRNDITYTLIDEPNRIEYDHGPSPDFHVTIKFEDDNGSRTRFSVQMLFPTKEERDRTVEKFGAIEGMNQMLGRFEIYLSDMKTEGGE